MDEAEQLCDRLAVMDHGRFAAEGAPRELIERYATREVLEIGSVPTSTRGRRQASRVSLNGSRCSPTVAPLHARR